MRIAIINGPNLNLLGLRNPSLYGNLTLDDINTRLQKRYSQVEFVFYQSNHEGDLIDYLQSEGFYNKADGIIINAGGYTHTSVALHDAIEMIRVPVVEVHITDIKNRESFRRQSYLTQVCKHTVMGQGTEGYAIAVDWLLTAVSANVD